ncbi:MAG TPA: hypothetical protein VKS03_07400, partial [Thermoanaerobaculia bacterium]|nr:hypothetical protein [Thermoanaerobaculia bacterium]
MKTFPSLCTALVLVLLAAPCLAAAAGKTAAEKRGEPAVAKLYEGLEFRNIGPYRGGRVTAVSGVRGRPLVFYQGAC